MHLAYRIAHKFLGMTEVPGATSNPQILAMLRLDTSWVQDDQTPWCSAFLNYCCWLADMPRSRSLAARSWLTVGTSIPLSDALIGDVVVLSRGKPPQPDASVIAAPGHVGFFFGLEGTDKVVLLGGNQGDKVSGASFPKSRILGVRRLL